MNQNSKRKPAAPNPEQHVKAIGRLLTQLRKHLIKSAGKKGTYSDYLRLVEFYSQTVAVQPGEIKVTWVDPEWIDPKWKKGDTDAG